MSISLKRLVTLTRRCGWLLALGAAAQLSQAQTTTLRVNQTDHPLDEFSVGAMRIALEYMDGDYELAISDDPITQTRAIERLESDRMDVMWLSSNQNVESRLRPIRFPLLKGLLGYRVFIINPNSQTKMNRVEDESDLKDLTFGQGAGWPDIAILEANDLEVITTSKYDNLFYMVEGGRFDAFPRGVLEPWTELAARPDLPLKVEERLVLVYPLPFYLFVSKENEALAEAIHTGLDRALAAGRYDEYFFQHPMIKDALTRSNLAQRRAFPLENPTLTDETPREREEYWLDMNRLSERTEPDDQ